MKTCLGSILTIISLLLNGCASYEVNYVPIVPIYAEPTRGSVTIDGSIEKAKSYLEQAKLPHNTIRQQFELVRKAGGDLLSQMGSKDYFLLGEVLGSGNAYSNLDILRAKLCETASIKGGDVVMIYSCGIQEQPYTYTSPGYATTNISGYAYSSGNYAWGNARGTTTYIPPRTYFGTHQYPYASGLVLRHVPGIEKRRDAIGALDDTKLSGLVTRTNALLTSGKASLEDYLRLIDDALSQ